MPTNNDYYYGYYGYDVDAPFNEFTQFIVMKPYTWLVGKVPNINNLLNVFSNLINDHNGVIVGGYLRRVIRSGDAFTFQNADLDIMFQSLDDFLGAVSLLIKVILYNLVNLICKKYQLVKFYIIGI